MKSWLVASWFLLLNLESWIGFLMLDLEVLNQSWIYHLGFWRHQNCLVNYHEACFYTIKHGIVTLPKCLRLGGRILWITALQFPSIMMFSLWMYLFFRVSISFKNLEYSSICWRAYPKGIVISNFLKISWKQARCLSLLVPMDMAPPPFCLDFPPLSFL